MALSVQIGNLTTRLPRLLSLDAEAAERYWERLGQAGLRQPYGRPHPLYGQLEFQFGTALDISSELAGFLVGAVRALDQLLKRYIREAGGLTAWLRDRAPTFGGVPLNFEAVNQTFERMLEDPNPARRMLLPLSIDCILTLDGGAPTLSVVELQTGVGYARFQWQQLEALGYDPAAPACWAGSAPPATVIGEVRRTQARGEDVSFLATFPSLTQDMIDEAGWASLFSADGLPRGYFLGTDVERDDEGFYHLEYEIDPVLRLPLLDEEDRPVRRGPARKRRIRHVITNQNQIELEHIHDRLSPERRARFLDFLSDAESVKWLLPHCIWYLADKSLMGRFGADLRAEGSPYADLFVPCFGPGELVAVPGDYVVKPIRGVSGLGVSFITVAPGTPFTVPKGHVAQQRFDLHPFAIRLAPELAGAFPVPEGAPGAAAHRVDPRSTTATLELRIYSVPGCTELTDSYMFMARVAPTWDPSEAEPNAPILTNSGKIMTALWNSPRVGRHNYKLAPFGWAAVTIGTTDSA